MTSAGAWNWNEHLSDSKLLAAHRVVAGRRRRSTLTLRRLEDRRDSSVLSLELRAPVRRAMTKAKALSSPRFQHRQPPTDVCCVLTEVLMRTAGHVYHVRDAVAPSLSKAVLDADALNQRVKPARCAQIDERAGPNAIVIIADIPLVSHCVKARASVSALTGKGFH